MEETHLLRLSIARLLHLVGSLLGEADAEESQKEAVGRLHLDVRLDQRLKSMRVMCRLDKTSRVGILSHGEILSGGFTIFGALPHYIEMGNSSNSVG